MATVAPPEVERSSPQELLAYLVDRFHPLLYVACSFQKEASVIMDMLLRIEPRARFFTLDTGVLFPETYAVWRTLEQRYGVKVEVHQGMSLERQAELHGEALWSRDPDRCCGIRKLEPLSEMLDGVDAWVTGLRRDQSPARAATPKLAWDQRYGLWKLCPLADWSERGVWRHIAANDVPYNPLHDRGYASIGCTHCTRPAAGRHGRWAGTDKIECGLHG